MTTAELALRIGVAQPRIPVLEKAEASGAITLESLERAARALDCEFVYVLVPRSTFEDQVRRQGLQTAQRRLAGVQHTMALEDQSVSSKANNTQIEKLARDLIAKAGSDLWSDR